jgi:uncharacterized membrane protein
MSARTTPAVTPAASHHNVPSASKQFAKHVFAIAVGFILAVAGLGMGVSVVLLPIGIPVGLVGVLMFLWGLTNWTRS